MCAWAPLASLFNDQEVQMTQAANLEKWKDMDAMRRLVFLGKLVIYIGSFGFAFPLLLNDE